MCQQGKSKIAQDQSGQKHESRLNYSRCVMEIMAKPETWVGLATNATAGRNETVCHEWGHAVIEIFVTHDSMAPIVARNVLGAKMAKRLFALCALYFVLCLEG